MYQVIPQPKRANLTAGVCNTAKAKITTATVAGFAAEGYRIDITPAEINLFATTPAGLSYAQTTLYFLKMQGEVPCGTIEDEPLYAYRGFMLDCSRHFFAIEEIKRIIDVMAMLKLNIFHWHLADDQGYRIESDKFPELNRVASQRTETRGDGIPHGGYYKKSEIRALVEYAKQKNIEIIPELDMPGHFSAIIAAYPHVSCKREQIEVKTYFGINAELACAGKESTYEFIFALLDEIFELFPYHYIHLGGDEAVKLRWLECPDCQKKLTDLGLKDEEELQSHFTTRIAEHCRKAGKLAINWNDGTVGGLLPKDMIVQYWRDDNECHAACIREVNAGMGVIMSPFFYFYLDYPHRMTPLRKTYSFDEHMEGIEDVSRVLGIEAPLWTEYVEDIPKLHRMTFPRLIAAAELAWTARDRRDYKCFTERLPAFFSYLDSVGFAYTPLKSADPKGLKGVCELIRFGRNAARINAKKSIEVHKAYKAALKAKYGK